MTATPVALTMIPTDRLNFFQRLSSLPGAALLNFQTIRDFSSYPSVIDFYFNSIVVRKYAWYDFTLLKYSETCFMTEVPGLSW